MRLFTNSFLQAVVNRLKLLVQLSLKHTLLFLSQVFKILGHMVASTSLSCGHHGHRQLLEVTVIPKTIPIIRIDWMLGLTKHRLAETCRR
jgi:hypothetical protein